MSAGVFQILNRVNNKRFMEPKVLGVSQCLGESMAFNYSVEVIDGIKIVDWHFAHARSVGHDCESFTEALGRHELLVVARDRRFPEDLDPNSLPPIYVDKDLPEYGFLRAVKLPQKEDDLVIDLDW